MEEIIYSFGECKRCGILTALKDGVCYNCEKISKDENSLNDVFGNIFGMDLFGKKKEE